MGDFEREIDPALVTSESLTLFAAGTRDWCAFPNPTNALMRLTMRLYRGTEVIGSNTVVMQLAPIILPWNSLNMERLYATTSFPTTVCPGKLALQPFSTAVWVQDYMELGASRHSTVTNLNQVLDLVHSRDDSTGFIQDYLLPEGTNNPPTCWHKATWDNDGEGGNIEVFPPYTSTNNVFYPFGRVVMGSSRSTGHTNDLAFEMIAAQKIQDPIKVQLDWLQVGHIDEVFSFLDAANVLVADPAYAMMYVQNIVGYSSWDQEIRVGTADFDHAKQTVTNAPNFFFDEKNALQAAVTSNDTMFVMTGGTYQAGDYLHIDGENVKVASNNALNVFVERAQSWGSVHPVPHAAGVPVYKWSRNMVYNVFAGDDGRERTSFRYQTCYTLADELQRKLGKPVNFVHIPVAFDSMLDGTNRLYLAATANMVNGVLDGTTFYMTDPGNGYFTNLVGITFNTALPDYTPQFIADPKAWNDYHCLAGEIHCGSNAKRTFPARPWWTYPELSNWPNR